MPVVNDFQIRTGDQQRFMLSIAFRYDRTAVDELDPFAIMKQAQEQGLLLGRLSVRGVDIESIHISALQ